MHKPEPSRAWAVILRLLVRGLLPAARRAEVMGDLWELWALRHGLGRRDLRRASLRDLWGLQRIGRWRHVMSGGADMWHDVRYAIRIWSARPMAAAAILTTLALGIGASAAIFSSLDALLIRPLPFPRPEQLVHVVNPSLRFGQRQMVSSSFIALPEIAAAGVWQPGGINLETGDASYRLDAAIVDDGFFATMGVSALVGVVLPPTDGTARVTVSYDLWQSRLGGDRSIVGQQVLLNGRPFTVTGVMPPRFTFPGVDVWIPPGADYQVTGDVFAPNVVARIAPGLSVMQASSAVTAYDGGRREDAMALEPLSKELTKGQRSTMFLLAGSVALLLLVVCASVANVLLAKVAGRQRDLQVRRALGAGRYRLVRQAVIESLVLCTAGGLAGLLVASAALSLLRTLTPPALADAGVGVMDARVLVIAVCVVLGTAVVLGIGPALAVAARPSRDVVRGGRTQTAGRTWRRVRSGLIVGQMAMALILLSAGTAAVATLLRVSAIDLGFGGTQAVAAQVTLPQSRFGTHEAAVDFIDRARARVAAASGVMRVAAAGPMPGFKGIGAGLRISRPGEAALTQAPVFASMLTASPDYFEVMGIPILAGRGVSEADRRGTSPVVVLSAGAARKLFEQPLEAVGTHVIVDIPPRAAPHEVIGVVADVYMRGTDADARAMSQMYFPAAQRPPFGVVSIVAEVRGTADDSVTVVRDALSDVDRAIPVYGLRTLDSVIDGYLASHRLAGSLMSAFAIVTLIVAAVGLFGVMTQVVTERRHEIGIRLALGAGAGDVRSRLIGQAMVMAALGAAIGAGAASGVVRALGAVVPSLESVSAMTIAVQALVLLVTAAGAAWWPTSRVLAIDAASVLRNDDV